LSEKNICEWSKKTDIRQCREQFKLAAHSKSGLEPLIRPP
jgi:hypothetical protein